MMNTYINWTQSGPYPYSGVRFLQNRIIVVTDTVMLVTAADDLALCAAGAPSFEGRARHDVESHSTADTNADRRLDFAEFCALFRERTDSVHLSEASLRARFDELDTDGTGLLEMHEYMRFALCDALARSSSRVVDLFRQ